MTEGMPFGDPLVELYAAARRVRRRQMLPGILIASGITSILVLGPPVGTASMDSDGASYGAPDTTQLTVGNLLSGDWGCIIPSNTVQSNENTMVRNSGRVYRPGIRADATVRVERTGSIITIVSSTDLPSEASLSSGDWRSANYEQNETACDP